MTWLQGTTTWGNLASDLTKLICGEMADGNGVTNSTPWLREFPAEDTIRTPVSKDVTTAGCSTRTGYFASLGPSSTSVDPLTTVSNTVVKVVTPYTTIPSSQNGRVAVRISLTGNSSAGNYSTASVTVLVYDLDAGTTINNTVTVNAAGNATLPNGLVVNVSDPSGIATSGIFVRGFMTGYLYGIDPWPMLHRSGGTAPTFTVAPPGVEGADWAILTESYTNAVSPAGTLDRGNLLHGLGIKTATANTGALYTVTHSMALIKCRVFASATAGVLSLDIGQSKKDTLNSTSTYRCLGGMRVTNWAKCFQTAANVTSTSNIQYFMSATADGIALVLNGDPGSSGKLGTAFIGAITPTDPTYDVLPVIFNWNILDYTVDQVGSDFAMGTQYPYWSLRRRQTGEEMSASRDWQTKWLRCEHLNNSGSISNYGGLSFSDVTIAAQVNSSGGQALMLSAIGAATNSGGNTYTALRQNKPGPDGKWWLFGLQYGENYWSVSSNGATISEDRVVRGQMTNRFLYIPSDGWGVGDELTDTSSGVKYLLVAPDYAGQGFGSRARSAASTFFGGVAVAEL